MNRARLAHVDARGQAQMVDVSAKPVTRREAIARGAVRMSVTALRAILQGSTAKGDVLTTAKIAGILAAKRTSELIPMTHPLPLTLVAVECTPDKVLPGIRIISRVRCSARTGAEMEALTAVAVTALTIVDMAKSADRWMSIEAIELIHKRGGKSGAVSRPEPPPTAPKAKRPTVPRATRPAGCAGRRRRP